MGQAASVQVPGAECLVCVEHRKHPLGFSHVFHPVQTPGKVLGIQGMLPRRASE